MNFNHCHPTGDMRVNFAIQSVLRMIFKAFEFCFAGVIGGLNMTSGISIVGLAFRVAVVCLGAVAIGNAFLRLASLTAL